MNEPDPAPGEAVPSSSPADEASNLEPIVAPERESLRRSPRSRFVPQEGAMAANDLQETVEESEAASAPNRRRGPWRWLGIPVAAAAVAAIVGGAMIWSYYSRAAAQYDLSVLPKLSQGTRVMDRDGNFVGTVFAGDRKFIKLGDAPRHLVDAVIATEDARFYRHGGIDIKAIARAFVANVTSRSVRQGGSTISQQLARQAFELKGKNLQRKLRESFVAMRLEKAFTKEEILEFYLNHIYLGNGFYGMGSAARGYFGKDVGELTTEEAAMLAGIIKAPVTFSPYRSPESAKRVRDLTLDRMMALGHLGAEAAARLKAKPVAVLPAERARERPDYLIAALERELEGVHRSGAQESVRVTVRMELQKAAGQILKEHIGRVEEKFTGDGQPAQPLQGAVIVLDNETGGILATIGGRDYRTSPFDRALHGRRPAGTLFLPAAYAAMISERPETASSWVLDGPLDNRRAMVGGVGGVLGEWGNDGNKPIYEGHVSAAYALLRGKTGAAVRLGYQAGLEPVRVRLQHCVESPLRDKAPFLLGSSAVRPLEMARVFSALLMDGRLPPNPRLAVAFRRSDGTDAALPSLGRTLQGFMPAAAQWVRGVMVAEMRQPAYQAVLRERGLAEAGVAGFGGTAYGFTDAWFAGGDREVTCVVWLGYDESRGIGENAWAKDTAFPLWAEVMAAATLGKPQGWQVDGAGEAICVRSGAKAGAPCANDPVGVMPTAPEMAHLVASRCVFHSPDGGTPGAPPGVAEVFTLAETEERRAQPARVRTVKAAEPVVVGPDIFNAVRK